MSSVNRSRVAVMVAVGVMAIVLGFAVLAQAQGRTTLFVPEQTVGFVQVPPGGATVSCTGTPFVLFVDGVTGPTSGGTCDFERFGAPGGNLVCDDRTTLFIRLLGGGVADIPISAFACSVPEEDAQTSSSSSSPAPVTQEGDQESESGEVDQSFEVS